MMQKKIGLSLWRAVQDTPSSPRRATSCWKILCASLCVVLLIDIFMPSQHRLWYFDTFLTHFGFWSYLSPSHLFLRPDATPVPPKEVFLLSPLSTLKESLLFIGAFVALLMLYLLAVHRLPLQRISYRYIWLSTLLLGMTYLFIPIVTSQDVFSYIVYARMEVLYHLNPLTTPPTTVHSDAIYPFLYWVNQPSVYGPTWVLITCVLQWVALVLGFKSVLSMQLLLRLFGLCMHLGSTRLIWSMSGSLHHVTAETISLSSQLQQQRLRATLAFAWNPYLLLEACVNAHSDTTILFLVLLALWFLFPRARAGQRPYLFTAALLAVAACLKITLVIFLPGLLLFLWTRHSMHGRNKGTISTMLLVTSLYAGVVLVLYAPFWQHGAVLHVFQITPGMTRDINSLYEALVRIYALAKGITLASDLESGSWLEVFSHQVSLFLFGIAYGALCLRSLLAPRLVNTLPALIRWMVVAWFLYCILGSPWFWPWYTTTFFGLVALIEANDAENTPWQSILSYFRVSLFARVLAITMLIMYSFGSWIPPTNILLFCMYFRGLWLWLPSLLVLCLRPRWNSVDVNGP